MTLVRGGRLTDPAIESAVVTPHDTNEVSGSPRALYVGVAGDVSMKLEGDSSAIVFKAMPVGIHNVRPKLIRSTSTTATNMVLLY